MADEPKSLMQRLPRLVLIAVAIFVGLVWLGGRAAKRSPTPNLTPEQQADSDRSETCKAWSFKAWQASEDLKYGKITKAQAEGILREVKDGKERNQCP